ncbi:MAG: hypothetical protein AAGJ87_01475 [Pseudomonadota bacterium]
MADKIHCGTHGRQETTFVCRHIIETLKDGEPRGFLWNVADGDFQAICEACNAMSDEEFAAAEPENINVLCFGCFRDAAEINGVVIA